jgi:hypothetical protein
MFLPSKIFAPWRGLAVVVLLLIGVPFALRLALMESRGFNPDEFEHLHFAWSIADGQVPYRDYFDHHTPLLHFLLAPLVRHFDVARSPDATLELVYAARHTMWAAGGLTLWLTFVVGSAYAGRGAGLTAALLLASTAVFLSKGLEVRPDVPAAMLICAAVWAAQQAGRSLAARATRAAAWLLASGLAWGTAVLLTQKVLMLAPGVGLAVLWLLLDRRVQPAICPRVRAVAALGIGSTLPLAVMLAYFWHHAALDAFMRCNFWLNAKWQGPKAGPFLVEIARQDPVFALLALAGVIVALLRFLRPTATTQGEAFVLLPLVSGVIGLRWLTYVSFQYFYLLMPLAAVLAATALVRLLESAAALLTRGQRPAEDSRPSQAQWPLVIVLAALSVQPLMRLHKTFSRGAWTAVQGIHFIVSNCSPWETVMDGFTGWGFARPSSFYYPFLQPDVTRLLDAREAQSQLAALQSGRASPKIVLYDRYMRDALAPEMKAFVERHYVRLGPEPIRVRPFDNGAGWWHDLGPRHLGWVRGTEREPHVFFADGWRDPGIEDGRAVRQTRTGRSKLVVPIRGPRDLTAVIHAKAQAEGLPFDIELRVNGAVSGRSPASAAWQDYTFAVPRGSLRPGFNDFELRSALPGSDDRRADVSVEWLDLRAPEPR